MQEYITQPTLLVAFVLIVIFYIVIYSIYSKFLTTVKELDRMSTNVKQLSTEVDVLYQTCGDIDSKCAEYMNKVKEYKIENLKLTDNRRRVISFSDNTLMAELLESEDGAKKLYSHVEKEEEKLEDSMMYM